MGTPLLGNIQRRCGPAGSTGPCQTGKRRASLLGTETSPGCMPKLGGLKYWGRAAGHMTLLKASQGMTSNPCLSEGFEEGSSLPTAGLGHGGILCWPCAGTQPQGHVSGKAFGPISLFSLFVGNWDLESAQGKKCNLQTNSPGHLCLPWSQVKAGESSAALDSLGTDQPL